jgi:hypothetical protein
MKKLFVLLILLIGVNSYAVVTEAGAIPILKNLYKSGVEMTKTLGGIQGTIKSSLNLDGFSVDGAVLTDKIAKETTEWVPSPFKDNAQNAVQACLQDFRKQLFAAIKWPSVNICGYDLIGDLKQDINDYLIALASNMEKKYGNLGANTKANESSEEKTENKAQKKNQLRETASNHNHPGITGRQKGIDMINDNSSFSFGIHREQQTFDNINLGRTLENIRNISNGMRVLGLKYNNDLLIPANLYKNQSIIQTDVIKNNMVYNQKEINSFTNILKYKEVEKILKDNGKTDNNLVIANKVNNQMVKNYIVVRSNTEDISVPGTNGKMTKVITEHEYQPFLEVYDNGKIDNDVLEEFNGNNKSNNFNYLIQANKIFSDVMNTTAQFVDSSDKDSKHRTLVTLLEGLNKLSLIQIAQDYQYDKVMLNITNNNSNVHTSLLKTLNDKIRLLQLTLNNLNIDLKNKTIK